ncbi:MAG: hypothetical protein SNJ70_03165 [Armatimonadota bacterium]
MKSKYIFILTIILISLLAMPASSSQETWQYYSSQQWLSNISDMILIDENIIIAGTANRAILRGGSINVSYDAGKSWRQVVNNIANINAFTMIDDMTIIAVGGAEGFGSSMYLGISKDKGHSWIEISPKLTSSVKLNYLIPLYGAYFLKESNKLFAVSKYNIYFSYDAGEKWEAAKIGDIKNITLTGDINFIDKMNGFAVTSKGMLYTKDSGNSWKHNPGPWNTEKMVFCKSIQFMNPESGLALVVDKSRQPMRSILFKSDNGGYSWIMLKEWKEKETSMPISLYFSDNILLAGSIDGKIWQSVDFGKSWEVANESENKNQIVSFKRAINPIALSADADNNIIGYYKKDIITDSTQTAHQEPIADIVQDNQSDISLDIPDELMQPDMSSVPVIAKEEVKEIKIEGKPQILKTFTASAVVNGVPAVIRDTFQSNTRTIFACVKTTPIPRGTRVNWHWKRIVDGRAILFAEYNEVIKTASTEYLESSRSLKPNDHWFEGDYLVEIELDGEPFAKVEFKVVSAE